MTRFDGKATSGQTIPKRILSTVEAATWHNLRDIQYSHLEKKVPLKAHFLELFNSFFKKNESMPPSLNYCQNCWTFPYVIQNST